MGRRLSDLLARCSAVTIEEAVWGSGTRLRVIAHLGSAAPPREYISSARAIVLREGSLLLVDDRDGVRHVLPGGRLEDDETPEQALHREIAEETGWQIGGVRPLGFLHFQHLTPKPQGYRYPYPNFLQVVYAAEATILLPHQSIIDDYVDRTGFVPIADTRTMKLTPKERFFIDAALASLNESA